MFRRLILGLSIVTGLWMLTPTSEAEARGWWGKKSQRSHEVRRHRHRHHRYARVPELDPGAAGSALVLLLGGVAYLASRRREEEDRA